MEEGIKHNAVFRWSTEVNDPDIFIKSIESGIGSAKGFGFCFTFNRSGKGINNNL